VVGTTDNNTAVSLLGMTTAKGLEDPNSLVLRAFNKQTPIESEKAYQIIMQKNI